MDKTKIITSLLGRFGRGVTVSHSGTYTPVRALIMPMRYKNKMYLDADVTDFGITDNSRTLYIGPVLPDFSKDWSGTVITAGDRKYTVTRADMIYFGEKPVYIWAILANVVEV